MGTTIADARTRFRDTAIFLCGNFNLAPSERDELVPLEMDGINDVFRGMVFGSTFLSPSTPEHSNTYDDIVYIPLEGNTFLVEFEGFGVHELPARQSDVGHPGGGTKGLAVTARISITRRFNLPVGR